MTMPSNGQRLSVRDINETLRALARQHAEGPLALAEYRARRDRLLDTLAAPSARATVVDDAGTETVRAPLPPVALPRRRGRAVSAERALGWMMLAVLVAGTTMTVAALVARVTP